ncbi:MAG TPA: acyltransferase [Candidatus Paceibacterota bacterium]|nr:acyltransferase [Candidatus Paceibacterota bacterium]
MSDHTLAGRLGALAAWVRQCGSVFWRWEARLRGVEFQGNATFLGRPIISVAPRGRIVLGEGVRIASALRANPLGLAQPAVLRAFAPGAELLLGPGVGVSGSVLCAGSRIEVGEQTIFGAGAMVLDNDFHFPVGQWGWGADSAANARPVIIGRGVFVGARAIVLKGVTIGDRAVVGAGAVVTQDVPAGHLAVGNPARIIARQAPDQPES